MKGRVWVIAGEQVREVQAVTTAFPNPAPPRPPSRGLDAIALRPLMKPPPTRQAPSGLPQRNLNASPPARKGPGSACPSVTPQACFQHKGQVPRTRRGRRFPLWLLPSPVQRNLGRCDRCRSGGSPFSDQQKGGYGSDYRDQPCPECDASEKARSQQKGARKGPFSPVQDRITRPKAPRTAARPRGGSTAAPICARLPWHRRPAPPDRLQFSPFAARLR